MRGYHETKAFTFKPNPDGEMKHPVGWKPYAVQVQSGYWIIFCRRWTREQP